MDTKHQQARKHHVNKEYFHTIDSNEKAYWLGFIMADGCISWKDNNPRR